MADAPTSAVGLVNHSHIPSPPIFQSALSQAAYNSVRDTSLVCFFLFESRSSSHPLIRLYDQSNFFIALPYLFATPFLFSLSVVILIIQYNILANM